MDDMNIFNVDDDTLCQKLKKTLEAEFRTQYKNGVYGFIQKTMAYSSNHLEGSTLTQDQTSMLFDTRTLDSAGMSLRVKDVEEAQGHFLAFNHLVKTLDLPLSEEMIKAFHYCLKSGVFEDRLNGNAIGEYKKRANIAGDTETVLPKDVPFAMKELLLQYKEKDKSLQTLAEFHADFEKIHPFQDGNGRVGRLILFREAVVAGICPFIVGDNQRIRYVQGIKKAQSGDVSDLVALFEEGQTIFRDRLLYFFGNDIK